MNATAHMQHHPLRVGIYATIDKADRAVTGLLTAGFSKDQITVVCSDHDTERHFREFEHQLPAGTTTGYKALFGAICGMAVATLATVGASMAVHDVNLLSTVGTAAVTGCLVGGLVGATMARGVEKELADYYDQAVLDG